VLTGVTLVRNGDKLKYPWRQCIYSLAKLCDHVIVNCDPASEDRTLEKIHWLHERMKNTAVSVLHSTWDMGITMGEELATQANKILPLVSKKTDWIVYMQADEMIHEKDFYFLKEYLGQLPANVSQVELYRTYFWKNLKRRAPAHETWLGRIFRPGTHVVGGDGMYLVRRSGGVQRAPYWIYHYSRMGQEEDVTARIRNLDHMFHPEDEVANFAPFKYDEADTLVGYTGTHPHGIEEFYGKCTNYRG